MKLLVTLALLLVMTLARATPSLPQDVKNEPSLEQATGEKITPEEESEAREMAALFSRRWEETGDIGPLVKEFYVSDFADRLRHETNMFIIGELDEKLLNAETRDELQRYYIASTNFLYLFFRFYETSWPMQSSEGGELDWKLMPAGVLKVLRGNPTLAAIMAEELNEAQESDDVNSPEREGNQPDAKKVKTLEQLKALDKALEEADALMRDYLSKLPKMLHRDEIERRSKSDSKAQEEADDPAKPFATIPGSSFYGYPEGTRFICVNILPFHIDMIRDGRRLKVVSVYLLTD